MKYNKILTNINSILDKLESKGVCKNVNRVEYLKDLYHLNKLVYDFYVINKYTTNKKTKIEKVMKLKSPDNKFLLNKSTAKYAVENLADNLVNHYDTIFRNRQITHEGGIYMLK